MSFKFNSDKEQIRGNSPSLTGDEVLSIRGGTGANEKEILRTLLDPTTSLPRVGINRTGSKVDKITVLNQGSGYTTQPTVTISEPTGDNPVRALASASLTEEGRIGGILIDNPGNGYTSKPSISIVGGGGFGATAEVFLDTVDFELDINGAIRTSTSIISDTARILNLDIDNLVTPDANYRAPNLKTFVNNTGSPWAPDKLLQKDTFVYRGGNVYQAMNVGTTSADPLDPPLHIDGIEINGNELTDPVPGVQFKHIGFRVSDVNEVYYNQTGDAGIYPRSITPLLGDKSDKIATTEYVLNLATNDVGGRIYVSQQIGNDENDGRSAVSPVRTIKKACQLAWSTPGVKESIIISGGDYTEDNPVSIPPDCSIVGDNLRLVIVRPANPRKHIFKFGDKNYVIGVTYRDQVDSDGFSIFTWDYAMVFDDKQRITYDYDINGDFSTSFPIGHQIFGEDLFKATFQSNGGLSALTAGQELRGVNAGGIVSTRNVVFNETDPNVNGAFTSGTFDFVQVSGSVTAGETLVYAGTGTERFQPETAYEIGDLVWTEDHLYNVTVAGVSGETNPIHDSGAANNGDGTLEFTYVRDVYSLVTTDILSIRSEGEVVSVNEDIVSALPITRIDFSLQGDASIATGGFGDYGSPEDLGGVVFYTNPLVEDDNIHDFKEGQEIEISGLSTAAPDLSFLMGKQRIYKVIEDPDGRSRRFVIPKKVPALTDANYDPGEFGQVTSYSKSVTLSLLNSPNKFNEATPVARRFQDAVNQIRNNRDFIADEVVKKINDQFKKEYFAIYDIGAGGGFDFKIFLGTSRFIHTYVSGGTVTFNGTTYNITDFDYDNFVTGTATITVDNQIAGASDDDIVQLADILLECDVDGVTTQKTYPSFNIPVSDQKCIRDVKHFLNALTADLEFGSNNNIIDAAKKYIDGTNTEITFVNNEIIQTVRAIEYARELAIYAMRKWRTGTGLTTDPIYTPVYSSIPRYFDDTIIDDLDPVEACANVRSAIDTLSYLFVDVLANDASGTYLDAAYLIARNRDHIADEAYKATLIPFPSLGLNNIDERKCRRDINYIISGLLRDLVLGGNFGIVSNAEAYFTGAELTGIPTSELAPTRYAFEQVRNLCIEAMRNWKTSTGNTVTPVYTPIPQFTDSTILVNADGTPITQLTPTNATYDPSNGDFVMTFATPHGVTTNDFIRLQLESFVFTCDMDNNRSEHYLPEADQPAGTQLLAVQAVTTNTITLDVGASGPNVTFDPTDASYDPATGDFTIEIGTHTLSSGEGVVLADNSFTFECAMDGYDSQKTYPRPDIDPFAGRSIKINSTTDTSITLNVGASGPNKYFTPTAADYEPTTGDMTVTVGQHGLGVGRSVVLEDNSFTFTCATDPSDPKTYPRPGQDPFAGKSIAITAVGNTTHSPSNADYDPAAGTLTVTLNNHGFSEGDYIKIDDDAITFTCDLDGNTTQHTYPRSYEYASGRWFAISSVTTNTFQISGLPIPGDTSTHSFVSFTPNGLQRQDGTFTLFVGTSSDTSAHTFVSATANAIKHEPQSVHQFVSASAGAVIHSPQSTHTFKRVTESNVVAAYSSGAAAHCANVEATITSEFELLDDILSGEVEPGVTEKTTGTLLDVANLYTYADSVISDFLGTKVSVRSTDDDFPIIEASPYTQNSSIISKLGGNGALIDGSKVKQPNCPFPGLTVDGDAKFPNQGKSMVASAFTIVSEGGTGYKIIEDGYVQLVSVFCIFTADGILAESGGYASVTNSASNFGIYSLRARGFRREAYEFDVCQITGTSSTPTGRTILSVSGLGREPLEHYIAKIDGYINNNEDIEYFVDTVEGVTVGPPFSAQLTLESGSGGPAEFKDASTGNVVSVSSLVGQTLRLHRPSIVNSSSHTWEYAGSGTSYLALPENGGVKVEANEQVSEAYGRTYVSGTDELGDFKVGTFARIENRTGNITFTGTVTISEVEFLKLKGGDVVVTGFDNSNTLGGANSSDSKLPTQKAVKDYITNNLGPYIGLQYSTFPVPRALVQLTDSGKINEDQIPPLRPFQVYTVDTEDERLAIEGALAGDIAIQNNTDVEEGTPQSYILNNDNESLFLSFGVDTTLQFTIGDVFTGNGTGGKIQATEYRQGVVYQLNITDGGSGYVTPPLVTISGNQQAGGVPATATATIANGQVVILTIELSNGYVGGKGYAQVPTVTIAPPVGSGTQATALALTESRLYGNIVNNIKIEDTDDILSSDLPAETVNINRVINTSGQNDNNWVQLSSDNISANQITSGTISPARLATNASGIESAANSFTFLRGDQSYAPAVQTLKGPETRYFAITKYQANTGASEIIFDGNSNFIKGHSIVPITGIQQDTNIDGVLTEDGETTIALDKFLTSTLPAGTVLEFSRGASPLTFESSQTQGEFVEEIVIQNGGQNFTEGTYFNVQLEGGNGVGLRANLVVNASGAVESATIVSGGSGYGQNTSEQNVDFVVTNSPTEIGPGSGLILLAKVTTVLRQYANVAIDINRVTDATVSGDAYGTLGVSRFLKSQFNIGQAGNGSVSINTGPDSGLDADTLDGAQGAFYLNSTNQNAGTLPVERLSGTYNISIANTSGNTLRLKTADAPLSNPTPDEFSAGIIADTKNNTADGLSDGGSKHLVLTIRNGGSDFDATFGGVRQLAFTDGNAENGGNMYLRGSFNSPANQFGNWNKVWTSGNDGLDSGLDADRMDGRQGTWYQTGENINYGILSNNRLPLLQTEKHFLNRMRVIGWSGNPRYKLLVRDELLSTTPFLVGQVVNLYDAGGNGVGSMQLTKVQPVQDVNDAANNYTMITGGLTSGGEIAFATAKFIGTGGVANAYEFQDWSLALDDANADGNVDGTFDVIDIENSGGNARFRLGRADGAVASDPSIYFRSSQLVATNYNSAIIASGGNATDGSGTLEIKVANNSGLTILGNQVWNAGTVEFFSSNTAPTLDAQNNITRRSAVMRDADGNFAAGTITASLDGAASDNVLRAGDTMSGALTIGSVAATDQALSVSGRADFLSNITVAQDLQVDTDLLFVDVSRQKVGVNSQPVDTDGSLTIYNGARNAFNLRVTDNTQDQGITFQNGGNAYTWNIYREDEGSNTASLVFRGNPSNGPQSVITDLVEYFKISPGGDTYINANLGVGFTPDSNFKLKVDGQIYADTGLTIRDQSDNNGAPIVFAGASSYRNFRIGSQLVNNGLFTIQASTGDGGVVWNSTPAIAVNGTTNQVAIGGTTFAENGIDMALNIEGNVNFNGTVYQNGQQFVTSRWTETTTGGNIYRSSKVGINTSAVDYTLDVDGDLNLKGTSAKLYLNGAAQWLDNAGVIKVNANSVSQNITIPGGTVAISYGPLDITGNFTVTISAGATWNILGE